MYNTIDAYIKNSSEVTQPIISHLRALIHRVSPDFEENIKWNAPSFERNGKNVCSIMAFKKYVNFMFHQGKELTDAQGVFENIGGKSNMSGIKGIVSLSDLPKDEILIANIKQAVNISMK